VLNIKTLTEVLRNAINKLLAPISNLYFRDTVVIYKLLTDNNSSLLSSIALKIHGLKISAFNIGVNYNKNSIMLTLSLR
jgi:hypothetical protein